MALQKPLVGWCLIIFWNITITFRNWHITVCHKKRTVDFVDFRLAAE